MSDALTHDEASTRVPVTPRLPALAAWAVSIALLLWPAFFNGYPLFFPDSVSYMGQGSTLAARLFLHRTAPYYGMRSLLYSLVMLAVHWRLSPWPVVVVHAITIAVPLWLLLRCLTGLKGLAQRYLLIMAGLCALTGLPWYVSFMMPDILGSATYLSLFVLAACWRNLARTERWMLAAIGWFGLVAHITHLMIAVTILAGVTLLMLAKQQWRRGLIRMAPAWAVFAGAIASILAINTAIYGKPSIAGDRPPFLMARLLSDGPARTYLQANCNHLHWSICDDVYRLPEDDDAFLWEAEGIWPSASHGKQQQLLAEEMPLAIATLRYQTSAQLRISAGNFYSQLTSFDYSDFGSSGYVRSTLSEAFPHGSERYAATREMADRLPYDALNYIQRGTVLFSLAAMACLWIMRPETRSTLAARLCLLALTICILNAAVTGILSEVDDRYQGRIIWLIPLGAALLFLSRKKKTAPAADVTSNASEMVIAG